MKVEGIKVLREGRAGRLIGREVEARVERLRGRVEGVRSGGNRRRQGEEVGGSRERRRERSWKG